MKLEELRTILQAPSGVENTKLETEAPASVDVKQATLNVRKGEAWERVGVDVLLSDDPHPEALDYARKCACGRMREVQREPGSSVHVILPCEACAK